jgi:hypothetical protein
MSDVRWIDRDGRFRGKVSDARIRKADSGAVGLELDVLIDEMFADGEWHDWREYQVTARGTLWLIKKDGSLNEMANETARDTLGWGGDPTDLEPSGFKPVSIVVEGEEYKGNVKHKIKWFNGYNETGTGGGASESEIKDILGVHGSKFRAFYGAPAGATATAPPKSRPAPPPVAKPGEVTKQDAWQAFSKTRGGLAEDEQAKAWATLLSSTIAEKDEDQFTSADWHKVLVAADDDIPF